MSQGARPHRGRGPEPGQQNRLSECSRGERAALCALPPRDEAGKRNGRRFCLKHKNLLCIALPFWLRTSRKQAQMDPSISHIDDRCTSLGMRVTQRFTLRLLPPSTAGSRCATQNNPNKSAQNKPQMMHLNLRRHKHGGFCTNQNRPTMDLKTAETT